MSSLVFAVDTGLPYAVEMEPLTEEIRTCRLCAERFANTATAHQPRPVVWLSKTAPILIVGQAPGARVHESGRPFTDPSGTRLRDWLGVDEATFYDRQKFSILPMAFCFPGYNDKGADLAPPPICAQTWQASVLAQLTGVRLTLLVGGYAQKWHLNSRNVTRTVSAWRDHWPEVTPLPHPSWRNTGWLKKNPWFAAELLPALRSRVQEILKE